MAKTEKKLTGLQKKFAAEFVKDPQSPGDCLLRAGSQAKRAVRLRSASDYLSVPKIQREIQRLQKLEAKKNGVKPAAYDPAFVLAKPSWESFAQAVFGQQERMNFTDAYQFAFPKSKSRRAAAVSASKLLTNPNIIARINYLKEQSASAAVSTVRERREILSQMERGNLMQFIEADGCVDLDRLRTEGGPAVKKLKILQVKNPSKTKRETESEIKLPDGVPSAYVLEISMHNPAAAIKIHNTMDGSNPPEEHHHVVETPMVDVPNVELTLAEWTKQKKEAETLLQKLKKAEKKGK